MKKLNWLSLLLLAAVIVLVAALPNTALAWLRSEIQWLGRSVNWVESLYPSWDTVHILLFASFGAMAQLVLPKVGPLKLLTGITMFSAATEAVQFWAPGRTARLSDFAQDVLGAVVGLFLVFACQFVLKRLTAKPLR